MVKVDRFQLFVPNVDEAASVIETGLKKSFSEVNVNVVDCPDLTKSPFKVAAQGLGGNTKIVQVGGVGNLLPLYKDDKRYDLNAISKEIDCASSLFIGAGAGPFFEIGKNSELISNVKFNGIEGSSCNKTFIAALDDSGDTHSIHSYEGGRFGLMADFFVSEGKHGQVLEVRVKHRTGEQDFISSLFEIMTDAWPQRSVGLGGVFAATTGRTKAHVMPEFSKTPLHGNEAVKNWLQFFEVSAPFVAFGTLTTNDPGYDIRSTHFHGINRETKEGGHFHIDLDSKEVEYLAYFNFSEEFIRYDQPV